MSDALHASVRDQMMEYLENLLDQPSRLALERHVAECDACARELELCRQTNALAAEAVTRPQLPANFYAKLREALPKPDHALVTEQLHEYLEGMLPHEARREFERHLADCESCSHEMALAQQAGTLLRDHLAQPQLPKSFYRNLRSALAAPQTVVAPVQQSVVPMRRRRDAWGVVYALSAIAACVLILLCVHQPTPVELPAAAPMAAGTLAFGGGSIWLNGQPVTDVRALQTGDVIETGTASRAILSLPGSGTVRLAEASRIIMKSIDITTDQTHVQVALLRGRVWVDEEAPTLCAVRTKDMLVEPAGTIFDVEQEATGTRCDVFTGRVALTQGTHTETVSAGQTGRVALATPGVAVSSIAGEVLEHDAFVQWNHDALLPTEGQALGQPLTLPTPPPVIPPAPVATPQFHAVQPAPIVQPPTAVPTPQEHQVIVLPPPQPGQPGVTVPERPRLSPEPHPDRPRLERPRPFRFEPRVERPLPPEVRREIREERREALRKPTPEPHHAVRQDKKR